jgi:phosphoribosylaminoimidazolecarboxamide formyltransferase / IMP cyclohydrolase
MTDNYKIQRALISVTDKTNLLPLAQVLQKIGVEIISTGGTGKVLTEAGIKFTEITEVTGNPEAFGGRMKTISFQIESALLFDRERDAQEAEKLQIKPIDLVVCNLYPFEQYIAENPDSDKLIEYIDIGGPTMIRAAAKNYQYVAVLTNPKDYDAFIEELQQKDGAVGLHTRLDLMAKAFNLTADYDSAIAQKMDSLAGKDSVRFSFTGGKTLRYGENSHQSAAYYRAAKATSSLYDIGILHGQELSYNNILDLQAAVQTASAMSGIGCAIIKHNNPCGAAESSDQLRAFELAWAGDPVSAFGGIVAFNTPVNLKTVQFLNFHDKANKKFIEIIAAPAFDAESLEYLKTHKNLRIVIYKNSMLEDKYEYRIANNTLLKQSKDDQLYSKMEVVNGNDIDEKQKELITFGLNIIRSIKSNAIGILRRTPEGEPQLVGMGSGQPNRLNSIMLACDKAKVNLGCSTLKNQGVILLSDAYFPFEDNVDKAHEEGIDLIVQPGGSIRDKYVIERSKEYGITLVFSGLRHFKH